MKGWLFFLIFWPLCCLGLAGLFVYQWSAGMPSRSLAHVAFPLIALIFFFIGMGMRRSVVHKQTCATILAPDAKVAYLNSRHNRGKKVFTPVYEYTVNGVLHRVSSHSGYSPCPVQTGEAVELYYSPDDCEMIYVPKEERTNLRWSRLLCGVGVLFPILAFFAPWIEPFIESLPKKR